MNKKVKLIPTKHIMKACCSCLYGEDEMYAGWCDKHEFSMPTDDFYGCTCKDWKEQEAERGLG